MQKLSGKQKVVAEDAAVDAVDIAANKTENNSPSNVSRGWG